jgi:hypothetical protein
LNEHEILASLKESVIAQQASTEVCAVVSRYCVFVCFVFVSDRLFMQASWGGGGRRRQYMLLSCEWQVALTIVYQPQAVFRVRPVSRCLSDLPGENFSIIGTHTHTLVAQFMLPSSSTCVLNAFDSPLSVSVLFFPQVILRPSWRLHSVLMGACLPLDRETPLCACGICLQTRQVIHVQVGHHAPQAH